MVPAQPQVVARTPSKKVVTRPLTLDEKIVDAKEAVAYEVKRITVCGYIFLAFGMISLFCSVNEMFSLRVKAAFIRQEHQIPWGNPNFTNFTFEQVTTKNMDRLEGILFDTLQNMIFMSIVVCLLLAFMGKAALRAAAKQKSRISQRMFRRHFFAFLLFLIFYVYTRKQGRKFRGVIDWMNTNDHDNQPYIPNNSTANNSSRPPFQEEEARRNLMAKYNIAHDAQLDDIFARHDIPEEVQQMMAEMRQSHEQMMNDMMHDNHMDNMFGDLEDFMRGFDQGGKRHQKKGKKDRKNKKHGGRRHEREPEELDFEEPEEPEWDGRKEAFRMFAPGLWHKAEEARLARQSRRGHGPMVRADKDENKKDAVQDWPKMTPMCPVMLFFIFASIYQICHIKFLEKALAKLEFLQKAKKLVKMSAKKQVQVQPVQPVMFAQPQPVAVAAPQPQAPKKVCKKVVKKQVVQVVKQPVAVMPVIP